MFLQYRSHQNPEGLKEPRQFGLPGWSGRAPRRIDLSQYACRYTSPRLGQAFLASLQENLGWLLRRWWDKVRPQPVMVPVPFHGSDWSMDRESRLEERAAGPREMD